MPVMEMLPTTDRNTEVRGDASMSPYAVERGRQHRAWNDARRARAWLARYGGLSASRVVVNPVEEKYWSGTASIGIDQHRATAMFP